MKVQPIAFDSLGVRSTATYVETDQKILIDPGAALGALRYGLAPAEIEFQRLKELSKEICDYAKMSDILTISHYHYDHYFPYADIYKGKILLTKDPKNNINKSQKGRAREFLDILNNSPKRIEFADDREFIFGKTNLRFSPAVRHGAENSKLGFVLMCSISYKNEKIIHASDIQGPQVTETTDWIIHENPDILILSGYPTIFLGWRFPKSGLEKSNENLIKILEQTKVKKIILDHHLARDLKYKNKIGSVLKRATHLNKKVITAAEFLGKEPEFLEARRKELRSQ